jgi:hypothetical protein
MRKHTMLAGLAAAAVAISGLVGGAANAGAATKATTYKFTNVVNPADPTFNQELGINDQQVIAGYYGNGTTNNNVGYNVVPPVLRGTHFAGRPFGCADMQVTHALGLY